MPAYLYVCPACGTAQEITKPMSESSKEERCTAAFTDDELCDAVLERDFNGQGSTFKLNGSGWTGKLTKRGRS